MPLVRPMNTAFASISLRRSVDPRGRLAQKVADRFEAAGRQVLRDAARADERVVHPQAGDQLEQVEDVLPHPDALQEDRCRPELEAERADPAEVRRDPVQLEHQHADDLGPLRDPVLDAEQSLHPKAVRRLVEQRRQVVGAGDERGALRPGPVLHRLLDAGVQVADRRAGVGDRLALKGEDQPEHAVRRRVLRPHVDDDLLVEAALAVLGDDLVPVATSHVVDTALGRIRFRVGRARRRVGIGAHEYDLLSSGGGTLVPRYSTGMPPSG